MKEAAHSQLSAKLKTHFSRRVFFLVGCPEKPGPRMKWTKRWEVVVEGLGHHADVVMVGGDGA